jgi:hypothetical protein
METITEDAHSPKDLITILEAESSTVTWTPFKSW